MYDVEYTLNEWITNHQLSIQNFDINLLHPFFGGRGRMMHPFIVRGHATITTDKVVAFGLGNPSVSVSRKGERARPGSLAHQRSELLGIVLEDQSEER